MIRLVDVSAYQPNPRWQEIAAAGAVAAIVKVSDGNLYTNPHAVAQVKGCIAAGLWPMLYHYARPNGPDWLIDAAAEGKRLDDLADALEQAHGLPLFCFLDVERNEPLTADEKPHWRDWMREFARWSREVGQRGIGAYSYKPFLEALELPDEFSNHVLWLARYPIPFRADPAAYGTWPTAIRPWKRADVWQDGGDANGAKWPGIDGPADVDCFAGSLQELQDLCRVSL